jgi:hypothetical protein
MGAVRGITQNINIMCLCVEKEIGGIMRIVAINEENTSAPICFIFCFVVEIFNPLTTQFAICPALF